MSTLHEKVQAQQWAFYSKPEQPFHRHLIGPSELEALLFMAEGICYTCRGKGVVDSGGETPWGAAINLPCPDCSPQREAAP